MNLKTICTTIFRLYLLADVAKMYHYSTDSNHGHELADQIRDSIMKFADELAEQSFGYFRKPSFGDMTVKHDVNETNDLATLCQNAVDTVEPLREEYLKNEKLSGMVSLIDDFKGEMGKMAFLGTFDKVTNKKLNI
ncbi:MAG: hypothetical protein LUD72_10590 [Bacteroidales bacterium]|nr:hypothetical protein [Bacteroidales bacterium]